MKSRALFLAVSLLAAAGCDDKSSTADQAANIKEIGPAKYVSWHDAWTVQKLQYAGANGGHYIGIYDPDTFSASAAKKAMQKRDEERGCSGRIWSQSKQDGIDTFKKFAEEEKPYENAFWADEHPSWESAESHLRDTLEMLESPHNLGVFSSRWDPEGEDANYSEGCLYWSFYIYRGDGTAVLLNYDYTD